MKIGKIITINDISVEIILSSSDIKIGDILEVENDTKYVFEGVEINNISATCISLYNTRGLEKGSIVVKKSDIKHIGDSLLSVVTINGDRIPDTPINCYPRNQIEEFADYIKEQLFKTL